MLYVWGEKLPPNAPLLRNQMCVCSSLFKLGITNAPVIYVSSFVCLTSVQAVDQGLEYASSDYHMLGSPHGNSHPHTQCVSQMIIPIRK